MRNSYSRTPQYKDGHECLLNDKLNFLREQFDSEECRRDDFERFGPKNIGRNTILAEDTPRATSSPQVTSRSRGKSQGHDSDARSVVSSRSTRSTRSTSSSASRGSVASSYAPSTSSRISRLSYLGDDEDDYDDLSDSVSMMSGMSGRTASTSRTSSSTGTWVSSGTTTSQLQLRKDQIKRELLKVERELAKAQLDDIQMGRVKPSRLLGSSPLTSRRISSTESVRSNGSSRSKRSSRSSSSALR